jgi:hypothetical protein
VEEERSIPAWAYDEENKIEEIAILDPGDESIVHSAIDNSLLGSLIILTGIEAGLTSVTVQSASGLTGSILVTVYSGDAEETSGTIVLE